MNAVVSSLKSGLPPLGVDFTSDASRSERAVHIIGDAGYGHRALAGARGDIVHDDKLAVSNVADFLAEPRLARADESEIEVTSEGLARSSVLSRLRCEQPDLMTRVRYMTGLDMLGRFLLDDRAVFTVIRRVRQELWPRIRKTPFPDERIRPLETIPTFLPWYLQVLEGREPGADAALERSMLTTKWPQGSCRRLLVLGLPRSSTWRSSLAFIVAALRGDPGVRTPSGEALRREAYERYGVTNCYSLVVQHQQQAVKRVTPAITEAKKQSSASFLDIFAPPTSRSPVNTKPRRPPPRQQSKPEKKSESLRGGLAVVEFDSSERAREAWRMFSNGFAHHAGHRLFALPDPCGLVAVTEHACARQALSSTPLSRQKTAELPASHLTVYLPRVDESAMRGLSVWFDVVRALGDEFQGVREARWDSQLHGEVDFFNQCSRCYHVCNRDGA